MLTNPGSMNPITWIDVARRLSVLEPTEKPWRDRPSGLRGARVDWRGATFTVQDPRSDRSAVIRWLSEIFPYRIEDGEQTQLILEGPSHSNRLLIDFEPEDWQDRHLRP